jgi:ribokinase
MTTVAVTGYASLDYVVRLEAAPRANATVIGARGGAWPRLGGSPSYVALALARAGVGAVPITWVGDDADGRRFIDALAAGGVATGGIAATLPGATPACILAYAPDGACYCLYMPGSGRTSGLFGGQRDLVRAAGWVCVTVGPAEATRAVLALVRAEQRLAWVVKADADAFPPELRAALAARADLVVHSRGERAFVANALAHARRIVVETRGAEGAAVTVDGRTELIAAETFVAADDPTGAGDTFAGGLLAALIERPGDAAAAVRAGQRAAANMLLARQQGGAA